MTVKLTMSHFLPSRDFPGERAKLRNSCAGLEILRMLKIFRLKRRMQEKLKKSENQRFAQILIDTVAFYD